MNTRGTMVDMVWVDEQMDDLIISCDVDEDNLTNHFSDHHALITNSSTHKPTADVPDHQDPEQHNWHKVDIAKLLTLIPDLLPPIQPLTTRDLIKKFDTNIGEAFKSALNTASPKKARPAKHKKWWRAEVLEPL